MVLAGIGGRTIAEAQERVSFAEFQSWIRYRQKRGSFNIGMRVERGAALLAALFANSKTKNGNYKTYDFAPHDEEPPVPLEHAMENWK